MFLVLSVSSYNFRNDDGEQVSGFNVQATAEPEYKENFKGLQVTKFNLPADSDIKFPNVPAYYDFDLTFKTVSGKAQAVIKSAKFVKPLLMDFHTNPDDPKKI
jgi:hypothetical protein